MESEREARSDFRRRSASKYSLIRWASSGRRGGILGKGLSSGRAGMVGTEGRGGDTEIRETEQARRAGGEGEGGAEGEMDCDAAAVIPGESDG